MRIVHASDLHIGFRAYNRATPTGRNVREQDVSDAFALFVDRAIELQPDLILIAGDVFHRARPLPQAIDDAMSGFLRLTTALPGVPVLVAQGNHDEPKQPSEGCALQLLSHVGAIVVLDAERIHLPDLGVRVLCVADRAIARTQLAPSAESGTHLLLAHGTIGGRLANIPGVDALPATAISPDFVYAALGDIHSFEEIAPNAYYCGAIDRTSSDPWREIGEDKGFAVVDVDGGVAKVSHYPLPTRTYIDLPRVSAAGLSAREVTDLIFDNLADVDVADAVVRQVIDDCPAYIRHGIDHRALRDLTAGALYFKLDPRKSETVQAGRFVAVAAPDEEPKPGDPDYYEPDTAPELDAITEVEFANLMRQAQAGELGASPDAPVTRPWSTDEERVAHYDALERESDARFERERAALIAHYQAGRIEQRMPLARWIAMHVKAGTPLPDEFIPDIDEAQEAEFEAEWVERDRRAAEMMAAFEKGDATKERPMAPARRVKGAAA